jgi:hypothetical protein
MFEMDKRAERGAKSVSDTRCPSAGAHYHRQFETPARRGDGRWSSRLGRGRPRCPGGRGSSRRRGATCTRSPVRFHPRPAASQWRATAALGWSCGPCSARRKEAEEQVTCSPARRIVTSPKSVSAHLRTWAERLVGARLGGAVHVPGYDPDLLARARCYDEIASAAALWSLQGAAAAWVEAVSSAVGQQVVLHHAARGIQRAEDVARNDAHDGAHHLWDVQRILTHADRHGET